MGSVTTAERQFVWGLRYIDDLVIRDRSTANNGTINERRYAMQDGNWNKQASTPTDEGGCSASAVETATRCSICDSTGSVGERYAYSAYGAPVFMTGAGTVQTSSPVGFETLYAGYRWDNPAPQMYYVRNRFLLPQVGTWNRRDPLGYVDGMALNSYCFSNAPVLIDPFGVDSWLNPWPWLCKAQEAVCGIYSVGPVDAWNAGIGWISDAAFEFQEIGKTGGEKNALRHCLWQALLCIENGRDCAESIGDAHERGRTGTNDSRADQHNNIEGRWCCSDAIKLHLEHRKKSHPTTTETVDTKREWDFVIPLAKQCCLRKFRDGTLIIDPDNDHRSNRHRGLGAGGLGSGSESGTSAANGSTSS